MLEAIISKIPVLSEYAFIDLDISRLSGYTNKNYLISTAKQKYVLRISQQNTNAFIDRETEAHNAETAYQLGIAPKCLWREQDHKGRFTGTSLSIFIKNGAPSTSKSLQNSDNLKSVANALVSLHKSKTQKHRFKGCLDKQRITALFKKYYQLCNKNQQQKLADKYQKAQRVLADISDSSRPFVASHIDLHCENILLLNKHITHPPTFTEANLWIIDWEYSAMASPYWDMASVLNSAALEIEKSERAQRFVQTIFDNDNSGYNSDDLEVVAQYQFIIKIFNACWQAALVPVPALK